MGAMTIAVSLSNHRILHACPQFGHEASLPFTWTKKRVAQALHLMFAPDFSVAISTPSQNDERAWHVQAIDLSAQSDDTDQNSIRS